MCFIFRIKGKNVLMLNTMSSTHRKAFYIFQTIWKGVEEAIQMESSSCYFHLSKKHWKNMNYYLHNFPILLSSISKLFIEHLSRLFNETSKSSTSLDEIYKKIIFNHKMLWFDLFVNLFTATYSSISRTTKLNSYIFLETILKNRISDILLKQFNIFHESTKQSLEEELLKIGDLSDAGVERSTLSIKNNFGMNTWIFLLLEHAFLDKIESDIYKYTNPKFRNYSLFEVCSQHRRLTYFFIDLSEEDKTIGIQLISERIASYILKKYHTMNTMSSVILYTEQNNIFGRENLKQFFEHLENCDQLDYEFVSDISKKFNIYNFRNLATILRSFSTDLNLLIQNSDILTIHSPIDFTRHEESTCKSTLQKIMENIAKFLCFFLEMNTFGKQELFEVWDCIVSIQSINNSSISNLVQRYIFQELPSTKLFDLLKLFNSRQHVDYSFLNKENTFIFGEATKQIPYSIVEDLTATIFILLLYSDEFKKDLIEKVLSVFKVCEKSLFKRFLAKICFRISQSHFLHSKQLKISGFIFTTKQDNDVFVNRFVQLLSDTKDESSFIDILDNILSLHPNITSNTLSRFYIHNCMYWATLFHYSKTIKFNFQTWIKALLEKNNLTIPILSTIEERIILEDSTHARQCIISPLELIQEDSIGQVANSIRLSILSNFYLSNSKSSQIIDPISENTILESILEMYSNRPAEFLQLFYKKPEKMVKCFKEFQTKLSFKSIGLLNYLRINLPHDHSFHSIFSFRKIMEKEISDQNPFEIRKLIFELIESNTLIDTSSLTCQLLRTGMTTQNSTFNRCLLDIIEKYRDIFILEDLGIVCKEIFVECSHKNCFDGFGKIFEVIFKSLQSREQVTFLNIVFDSVTCRAIKWNDSSQNIISFLKIVCQCIGENRVFTINMAKHERFPLLLQRLALLFSVGQFNLLSKQEFLWFSTTLTNNLLAGKAICKVLEPKYWICWLTDLASVINNLSEHIKGMIFNHFMTNEDDLNSVMCTVFVELANLNIVMLKRLPLDFFTILRMCDRELDIYLATKSSKKSKSWFLDGLKLLINQVGCYEDLAEKLSFIITEIFDLPNLLVNHEHDETVVFFHTLVRDFYTIALELPSLILIFVEWSVLHFKEVDQNPILSLLLSNGMELLVEKVVEKSGPTIRNILTKKRKPTTDDIQPHTKKPKNQF